MSRDESVMMKGHEAIARALVDNGIDTMFGVLGNANIFIVDSFRRALAGRYVAAANEGGAVLMALAHGACAGKVGVATVTHGPGLSNTVTALIEGAKARVPMVLLCGDTAVENRESSQNIPQRELVLATGAGFEQAITPATVVADLATAIRRAEVERRPVVLNFPANFQWADVDYRRASIHRPCERMVVPEGADIENAVGMIANARKPIIIAGRGAVGADARAALVRLADRTGAMLATTLKARDLFEGERFNLGVFGTLSTPPAVDEIIASDCLIVFGAGLNNFTTNQRAFAKDKRIIHCDRDLAALGRHVPIDAGLVGDVAATADLIVSLLDMAEIAPSGHRDESVAASLRAYSPVFPDTATETTIGFHQALLAIDRKVSLDRFLVTDAGRFILEAYKLFRVRNQQHFYYPLASGSIGLGLSSAIGAFFASPDRPALLIAGDGGFMNGGLAEFQTAVRNGVDLIVVICNDGGYGMEEVEFRARDMPADVAMMEWADFAPVADALGGQGVTVRNQADLEAALVAIDNRTKPLLIDLKIDMLRMPGLH